MKKLVLSVLLLTALCGCSDHSREIETGMALRTRLLKAESFTFDADITADYGDELQLFSVRCRADGDGNVDFTVTAPETIADITGTIDDEGGRLTFEDTALYFKLLNDGQLSPVSAPWILVKTLRSGFLTSACQEEEGLRLTVDEGYEDHALTLDIWLNEEALPERAEILCDGRRILTMSVKNAVLL